MLVSRHLPILGDKVIMVPSKGKSVPLPSGQPAKRTFPPENNTVVPNFKVCQPTPGVNIRYNNWGNSERLLTCTTKESRVANWFNPAIDWQLHAKLLP